MLRGSASVATRRRGQAALGEAQDVALATQLEVLLGELEAVRGPRHRPRGARARWCPRPHRSTRTQNEASVPRPTRPRSWWSWASPKRSAPSMIISVASGTSTPTSTTVVPDQHVEARRRGTRAISASRSAGRSRPWTRPTRSGASSCREPGVLGLGRGGPRRLHVLVRELVVADPAGVLVPGRRRLRPRPDARHHDERAAALGGLVANALPRAVEVVRAADPGPDRDPALGRRCAGWRRRGPRTGPGPASAGSASRS